MQWKELAKSTKKKKYCYCKGMASTPVMFLVAVMPLPAKGRAKTLTCNPYSWGENYSCKILKSQLKALDEYTFKHIEIFKILYL